MAGKCGSVVRDDGLGLVAGGVLWGAEREWGRFVGVALGGRVEVVA